jgi:hypothetical protein
MIGRPYERTAFNKAEAFAQAGLLVFCKYFRANEFSDRKMFGSRLKILAHSKHITTCRPKIIHSFIDLSLCLTQSEHNARFGLNACIVQTPDNLQASVIFSLYPYLLGKPAYCFPGYGKQYQDLHR